MKKSGLNIEEIKSVIDYSLKEDIGNGDITTNSLIPIDLQTKATMVAKSTGIIAGLAIAEYVLGFSIQLYER